MIAITISDIKDVISFFKDQIIDKLGDAKKDVEFYFCSGFNDYLESIANRFLYCKTFLHRLDNIYLYDIYFNTTLNSSNRQLINSQNIDELFESSQFITIIGNAGSGKSMLLKHIYINSFHQKYGIPLFIELRNLNQFKGTFIEYINELLVKNKAIPSDKILESILKKGQFIFLLDGYDEIFSSEKERVTTNLNNFIDTYSSNKFLITARPGSNIELLPRFTNYYVNNLTEPEIQVFIVQQLKAFKKESSQEWIDRILLAISKKENNQYKAYLKNPLLLSMFILTFENSPEIPKTRSKFYSNVFTALSIQHNALSKHGFEHEKKSKLNIDQIENILKAFSFLTYFKGEYSFDYETLKNRLATICSNSKVYNDVIIDNLISDLTVAIPIIVQDGFEYKYPHRSLQEYFSAEFISKLEIENKEKIYTHNFRELYINSSDSYFNFWQLCYELDKNSFSEYFLINNLGQFLSHIDLSTNETTIESLLDLIDLDFRLELTYITRNDNAYIDPDDYGYHDNENPSYYLGSGDIIGSKWSSEFDFYKNLFKFLAIFHIYKIIEIEDTVLMIDLCSQEKEQAIYKEILSSLNSYDNEDDLEDELFEQDENDDEVLPFDVEQDDRITVEVNINVNRDIDLPYQFATQVGIDAELLQMIDDVKRKKEEILREIKTGFKFNNDLIETFIKL